MGTPTRAHRTVALRIALPRQLDLDRVALCITTRKKKNALTFPAHPHGDEHAGATPTARSSPSSRG